MISKTITVTDAKNRFAELVDSSRLEPITITRNDRPVAILVSPEEYTRLVSAEDAYWGRLAAENKSDGYLSPSESEKFLHDILTQGD